MSDLEKIVAGEHWNPHAWLGAHLSRGRATIRCYRPGAHNVDIFAGAEKLGSLERIHDAGVFEGSFDAEHFSQGQQGIDYELSMTYADGVAYRTRDPYSFLPTLGDVDIHLFSEGTHRKIYEVLGAHARSLGGADGVSFAVWAPNARSVRVVGDFNHWDGRIHPMRSMGSSGVWEIFIPQVQPGARYKFEILGADGVVRLKADPFAFQCEHPPDNAAIVHRSEYTWKDEAWVNARRSSAPWKQPVSVYEVHLGSWRQTLEGEVLGYRELASKLAEYCQRTGFTHVEIMPVAEHPFTGSWGYQVTGYYAPTARYGGPDDFRAFVDTLHQAGIGVIVDWVPAHFPKDEWALGRFDGTPLFEHADPRRGEHPDWGTYIFNYGRNEVRNFLTANALYFFEQFHIDGLRVDAVASMLYLDYSREEGQWVKNEEGGRENLEAVHFLRELNTAVYAEHPGIMMIAEESTAWDGVTRPVDNNGLGFGFKWNMGWMHDTLEYFKKDPVYRQHHHNELTFSLMYSFSESYILPISHDEVVHGKGSLIDRMPGDRWQQLANLRAFLSWQWSHPGKQTLFMGCEFAQSAEWNFEKSLDWHLLDYDEHSGVQRLVADLNAVYKNTPALWERDHTAEGFSWIDGGNAEQNLVSYVRFGEHGTKPLVCVCNLSPQSYEGFVLGVPEAASYRELLNTDADVYGGSNIRNLESLRSSPQAAHGQPHSITLTIPPLAALWLTRE